jgi:site-specific DNA recombinase
MTLFPLERQVRCAVYCRKSTDEGLDKDFNSLDAQRECGEAYIRSQAQEGWICLPDPYDDGGFTGGNMDRPALQRLLADIEAGRVDMVVTYKVECAR